MQQYDNRREAGVILGESLDQYRDNADVIVLALPRGGVPVAYEVANALHAPLDVYIVRKLGVPGHKELAMGAIAQGGAVVFNQSIINEMRITKDEIDAVIAHELQEVTRRSQAYRGNRPFPSLKNKTIILVDDGIATGATMKAAIQSLRQQKPRRIIVAVPVADETIGAAFERIADDFVCPMLVDQLQAVGLWYQDFSQTEDDEVRELLRVE